MFYPSRVVVFFLGACGHPAPVSSSTPTAASVAVGGVPQIVGEYAAGYRLAALAMPHPGVAGLCRMAIPGQDIPYHADGDVMIEPIRVYVNEAAWPAMQQTSGERQFAEGSAIVKVKPDGSLGVMFKAEGEGWRYAYVDTAGQIEEQPERLTHCVGCHQHGTVPEEGRQYDGFRLDPARDAVFLSVQEQGAGR